ncbi:hypothetical protein [Streptomyces zagrosensis]|uniref:Uncharacterized protein n=1 Tax=Streptomyces zagrosensis TaxID=1042984 RepID=A0A7W9UX41_9ACTN|nr:hypothetical protein [Streptomyces zagrosensis]MBB5934488.1 hypothetical protein [Streptomyces zagrosensis]
MSAELIVSLVIAVLTIFGGLWQARKRELRSRERAKHDAELLAALPDSSTMKDELTRHIDETIRKMIAEDSRNHDPFSVALAIVMLLIAGGLIAAAAVNGGAWWWLTAPAGLIAIVALPGLVMESTPRISTQD